MTEQTPGNIFAVLTIHADGQVAPGPGQTWEDVPESSRPEWYRSPEKKED